MSGPLQYYQHLVRQLKPGHRITFDMAEFRDLEPATPIAAFVSNMARLGSVSDQIMEGIVGSAYEYLYLENHMQRTVSFERLRQPLSSDSGLRTYVSPDRRDRMHQRPDGLWESTPSAESTPP